jgi:hypothetical protein
VGASGKTTCVPPVKCLRSYEGNNNNNSGRYVTLKKENSTKENSLYLSLFYENNKYICVILLNVILNLILYQLLSSM